MAFKRADTIVPQRIGKTVTHLFDPDPTTETPQSATVDIQVVMSDGSVRIITANIAEHFDATVINQLRSFVASVRTKAVTEILPT